MGKSLIIKGADFSANGIQEDISLDITGLVAESVGRWYPRRRITTLAGNTVVDDNYKSCVARFDLSTVPNYELYSKIRITFADNLNYVFSIGIGTDNAGFVRVTGIDTTATNFVWTTDNHIGEIAINENRIIININIRIGAGTSETFPVGAALQNYMQIQLLG